MSSVIQNLLQQTVGDGARASKFECFIHFKDSMLFPKEQEIISLVKTSQFPGKSHDTIDLKFKGRSIPVKGQTKYNNTWSCTFYTTEDHALKKAFEDWIESLDQQHNIKKVDSKVASAQMSNSSAGYTSMMRIAQLDFNGGQDTVIYNLYDCFPKSVSGINVDYSNQGPVLEFTVEFSYSYYDSFTTKSILGSFIDDIKNKALGAISTITGEIKNSISGVFESVVGPPLSGVNNAINSSLSYVTGVRFDPVESMFTKFNW